MDLVFLGIGVFFFIRAFVLAVEALQNQDVAEPRPFFSIGKHGLNAKGRAHQTRFWKSLGLAIASLVVAILLNVLLVEGSQ